MIYISLTLCKHACKVICDVKAGCQDLLGKGKNGLDAFQTGAKISFSEKKYFGVRGHFKVHVN